MSPKNAYVEILTPPNPQNVAVPGEKIIADVTIQVILEWGGPESKMTAVLMKRGNLEIDTHTGKTPCECEGRDWHDVSTSQGMPKTATVPPETRREAQDTSSLTALRRKTLLTP